MISHFFYGKQRDLRVELSVLSDFEIVSNLYRLTIYKQHKYTFRKWKQIYGKRVSLA